MASVEHADDDFLSDVAPLGHRDRAVLDTGLERDRVVGHVDAEHRIPRLDARRLDGCGEYDDSSSRLERGKQRRFMLAGEIQAITRHADLIDADDGDWCITKHEPRMLVLRPASEIPNRTRPINPTSPTSPIHPTRPTSPIHPHTSLTRPTRLPNDFRRAGPMYPDGGEGLGQRLNADVLGEDELVEACDRRVHRLG